MRVTALSVALCAVLVAAGLAQITSRFNDTIAAMSAALAEDNSAAFLEHVDKNMPGYERLKANVEALVNQADVHSGVDQIVEDGNEVTVEWEMQITPHGNESQMEPRSATVHLKFEQDGKKSKVVALDRVDFFEPPHVRR
jgi:SnoaL-like domain